MPPLLVPVNLMETPLKGVPSDLLVIVPLISCAFKFATKKSNKNDIIILELQTLLKNHIANTEGNIKRCLDNQEYILYELKKINRYKDLQNEVW